MRLDLSGDWGDRFRQSAERDDVQRILHEQSGTMRWLEPWYDNDGLWDWGEPERASVEIDAIMSEYAHGGCRRLSFGVGGNQAWNFYPAEMERAWANPKLTGPSWQRMREYEKRGYDLLRTVLDAAHKHEIAVYANIRLNRYHPNHGLVDSWFMGNPGYHLPETSIPWLNVDAERWPNAESWRTLEYFLDFGHAEVRSRLAREVTDVVDRYDVDGLSLELVRALPMVRMDDEDKKAHVTAFLQAVRERLGEVRAERGGRCGLAVWIPSEEYNRKLRPMWPAGFNEWDAWGFDPEEWSRTGAVDAIQYSAFGADLEMEEAVPPPPWYQKVRSAAVEVFGAATNVDHHLWTTNDAQAGSRQESITRSQTVVAALQEIRREYDGLFLFNTQPHGLAALLDEAEKNG